MFGELKPEAIEELISKELVGRIGCHADGVTYVVPISYAYDGTYLYCRTVEGMKMRMMRMNPQVCFEVENTKDFTNWQSAIAWGEFEELSDESDRKNALEKLQQRQLPMLSSETMHLTPYWPFNSADSTVVSGVLFRIRLTKKTGRFEKSTGDHFFAS